MVGLAAHIAHRNHEVSGDLALHRKAPFLDGGREHGWIEAGGLINRAGGRPQRRLRVASGREGGILLERKVRKPPVCYRYLLAGVKGWIRVGAYAEVIQEIVVDSEAGTHGPGSPAGRIPGKAHARLQQEFGVVLLEAGIANVGIGLDHEARVIEIVGTPAKRFIPAVGKLVPQPQTQVEITPQGDFVLDIPGSFPGTVANRNGIANQDRCGGLIQEKFGHVLVGDVSC